MKKKICIIFLILVVFLSISTVSAASDVEQNTTQNLKSTGDYINFKTLNNIIVESNGTVNLTSNVVNVDQSYRYGININKNTTINGNGYIIDADNYGTIFNVKDGVSLTLNNITLKNANSVYYSEDGGAIRAGVSNLIVINSSFINNNARVYATDIYALGSNVVIINSSFISNKNQDSPYVISVEGGNLSVINSSFINNTCAPICIYDGNLSVINSNFTNIRWSYVISPYHCCYVSVINSNFINCSQKSYDPYYFKIFRIIDSYDCNVSVINSSFINVTSNYGRGIIYSRDCNVSVINPSFININSTGCIYQSGGVINVTGSNFTGITGMNTNPFIDLSGCVVFISGVNCNGFNGSGNGIVISECVSTIIDSVFTNNYMNSLIDVEGGFLRVIDSVFTNNSDIIISNDGVNSTLYLSNNTMDVNGDVAPIQYSGIITSDVTLTILNNHIIPVNLGDVVNITGILTDDRGNLISGMGVTMGNVTSVSLINGTYYNNYTATKEGKIIINGTVSSANNLKVIVETIEFKLVSNVSVIVPDFCNGTIVGNVTLVDSYNNTNKLSGNVTVLINNKSYTVVVVNGEGKFTIVGLDYGNYNVTVSYNGAEYIIGSSANNSFVVGMPTFLIGENLTMFYHNGIYSVLLKDYYGNVLVNKSVSLVINGVEYNRFTDDKGIVRLNINLSPGTYDVIVNYKGYDGYESSNELNNTVTVSSTIVANSIIKYYKNGTQFTGIAFDNKGAVLKNTEVCININGIFYYRTSDDNGFFKLNINLGPGLYVATVKNIDGLERSYNITVISILEINNLTKYYKNSSQYEIKLLDDMGNPLANTNVTVNINGLFYTRTTNVEGVAILNINLSPGEYIATVISPNGLMESSIISVLSIIESNDLIKEYGSFDTFNVSALSDTGNPVANVTVAFNINGMFFNSTTGSDGVAHLNIDLMPGEYIITSTYNGCSKSNTITVL